VSWDDLAGRGDGDADAVRELTRRMEEGLRGETINLGRQDDALDVLAAYVRFNAVRVGRLPEAERVLAVRGLSRGMCGLGARDWRDWRPVARDVSAHSRKLEALGLRPDQLSQPQNSAAVWTLRQLVVLIPLAALAVPGAIAYAP